MIFRARVTRVTSWSSRLEEEELDFFLFTSSGVQDYERALGILKERPIAKENELVRDFTLGLGSSGVERIRFTIERVNDEHIDREIVIQDAATESKQEHVGPVVQQDNSAWLSVVDHITYVVKLETFRKWAWFYIKVLGGRLTTRCDDVDPDGKSSMMLWTIDFGNFSIALVAGIDREEKSHVTAFVERHGDRTVQHVAFRPRGEALEDFLAHLRTFGLKLQGAPLARREGSAFVKQIFAWPSHKELNPAKVGFDEFETRGNRYSPRTFSTKTGKELYDMAQALMASDVRQDMINWSLMPDDWEPN